MCGVVKCGYVFLVNVVLMVFVMMSLLCLLLEEECVKGVCCVMVEDCCWLYCDIKLILLFGNVLMVQYVVECDVFEMIQLCDENVMEGLLLNVWIVKNGELFVLLCSNKIFEGICYVLVEQLVDECGIWFVVCEISEVELCLVDEIMLMLVMKEILFVMLFDDLFVQGGKLGFVFVVLYDVYQCVKVCEFEQFDLIWRK